MRCLCCDDDTVLDLPPAVIEMLARYRRMRAEHGFGWGEDPIPEMFRWARFSRLGPAFTEYAGRGDWAGAVRAALGDDPPPGLVRIAVSADGELTATPGPPRLAVAGVPTTVEVVLDSTASHDLTIDVAGQAVPVPAGGAGLAVLDLDVGDRPEVTVTCGNRSLAVDGLLAATPAATLALSSPDGARWSITDATGGAWFGEGVPQKWDADDRPYFHTDPGTAELTVPAGPLHVVAARGMEFVRQEFDVAPEPGETVTVTYGPKRRVDPAAGGWYGADLHVHLNYSGDHVLHPADAARMQRGEGLHLMQLAAGNLGGDLVYDLELLEATVGRDLWDDDGIVARAGLEFRNSLLGHVHGLGLTGVPELRHTGDEGTAHAWDWPPNSVACGQQQELGAVTTYAHPVYAPGDPADPRQLFRPFRMVEARELVADAALGVVDAVELASCFDDRGAETLYHHLLSCGLRLAATAGTDAFLSFARQGETVCNPPGWARVYARLDGRLTVPGFADAVRAGRTLVTNGPWLTLDVAGHGPGDVLDRRPGDAVAVRVSATGAGRLVLHGPDGELAASDGPEVRHEVRLDEDGLWLAAAAYGPPDPYTPGAPAFAHTSPVFVDVAGRRPARAASARYCLALLDDLQDLLDEHAHFDADDHERQRGDLVAVLDRARDFYRGITDESGSRDRSDPA